MIDYENPISTPDRRNQASKERFQSEIQEYDNLLQSLKGVEGLSIDNESARISLAFLLQEMREKKPTNWHNMVRDFIADIGLVNKKEGEIGVSWLLSENISSAYTDFLKKRANNTGDQSLKRKLVLIGKNAEQNLEFNRKAHGQGQSVDFGGVSMDYIPEWYRYIERK